jgi:hypothetical protein
MKEAGTTQFMAVKAPEDKGHIISQHSVRRNDYYV